MTNPKMDDPVHRLVTSTLSTHPVAGRSIDASVGRTPSYPAALIAAAAAGHWVLEELVHRASCVSRWWSS